jgi:hypothetical protein
MTLSLLLRAVPVTVARHEATFGKARETEPAFAPYATATALLGALAPQSPLPVAERQPLAQAVLRHHQTAMHPLWQALLVGAFEPVLRRLSRYARGSKEDHDQQVLLAFLQALRKVRPSGQPVFLAVQRATARELFGALHGEADPGEMVPYEERQAAGTPSPHADAQPFVACLAHEVLDRLVLHDGGEEAARGIVGAETHDGRLRRRRSRVIGRLRAELARR